MRISLFLQSLKNFKIVAVLVAVGFITIVLFGMNIGMDTRQDGSMTGCMLDQSIVCPMSIVEHINQWQQSFIAISKTANLSLLVLLLLLVAPALFSIFLRKPHDQFIKPHAFSINNEERNRLAKLFDYILKALSDGRLNPIIYESSYNR